MRVFISGGCKNGKSFYAQRLARAQHREPLYYIATMKPVDLEDNERIVRHRKERDGWGFTTIEQPLDIEGVLSKCDPGGSFLLDSLTALLANEMFLPDESVNDQAAHKIISGLVCVIRNIENIVVVSDYIYSDALYYDSLTEKFRASLAAIDRVAAENCDVVLEAAYSSIIAYKGLAIYEALS